MPRNYKLTPNKKQRRWFKKYRGRQFAFGYGKGGSQESSYPAALAAFEAWKANVDKELAQAEPPKPKVSVHIKNQYCEQLAAAQELVAWHRAEGREAAAIAGEVEIANIKDLLAAGTVVDLALRHQGEEFAAPVEQHVLPDETIAANVKAFLVHKRATVSPGRAEVHRIGLNHLMDFIGEGADISRLNGVLLSDYHLRLVGLVKQKEISDGTAKDRFDIVKQFVKWLWGRHQIELPRNLDSLAVKKTQKAVSIICDDQVEAVLNAASERTRLYVLLALNCGFTQVDIGTFTLDQVDWKTGRIQYKRRKTEQYADVPLVDYKLWGETFTLLRRHRSEAGPTALLNEDGKPLWQEGERKGRYYKNDNVRTAFNRVLGVLKADIHFKQFRKVSATKLASNAEHARFVPHFLGHSPRTIADRHYVQPSRPQFDAAVKWLGEQFGF